MLYSTHVQTYFRALPPLPWADIEAAARDEAVADRLYNASIEEPETDAAAEMQRQAAALLARARRTCPRPAGAQRGSARALPV